MCLQLCGKTAGGKSQSGSSSAKGGNSSSNNTKSSSGIYVFGTGVPQDSKQGKTQQPSVLADELLEDDRMAVKESSKERSVEHIHSDTNDLVR